MVGALGTTRLLDVPHRGDDRGAPEPRDRLHEHAAPFSATGLTLRRTVERWRRRVDLNYRITVLQTVPLVTQVRRQESSNAFPPRFEFQCAWCQSEQMALASLLLLRCWCDGGDSGEGWRGEIVPAPSAAKYIMFSLLRLGFGIG